MSKQIIIAALIILSLSQIVFCEQGFRFGDDPYYYEQCKEEAKTYSDWRDNAADNKEDDEGELADQFILCLKKPTQAEFETCEKERKSEKLPELVYKFSPCNSKLAKIYRDEKTKCAEQIKNCEICENQRGIRCSSAIKEKIFDDLQLKADYTICNGNKEFITQSCVYSKDLKAVDEAMKTQQVDSQKYCLDALKCIEQASSSESDSKTEASSALTLALKKSSLLMLLISIFISTF